MNIVLHSGGEEKRRGVAVILEKRTARSVQKVCYEGDRLMMVKLSGKPVDVIIVLIYLPTTEHDIEEMEEMHERIEKLLNRETKGKDYTVIMGDWNAIVGEKREENVVGEYGLGSKNKRGEKLIEFCRNQKMYVTNT